LTQPEMSNSRVQAAPQCRRWRFIVDPAIGSVEAPEAAEAVSPREVRDTRSFGISATQRTMHQFHAPAVLA
jgi:hypothetical protein